MKVYRNRSEPNRRCVCCFSARWLALLFNDTYLKSNRLARHLLDWLWVCRSSCYSQLLSLVFAFTLHTFKFELVLVSVPKFTRMVNIPTFFISSFGMGILLPLNTSTLSIFLFDFISVYLIKGFRRYSDYLNESSLPLYWPRQDSE